MPSRYAPIAFLILHSTVLAADLTPAGAARIDITPKYAVRLSGYGSRRAESEGVAQPIFAKALAIGEKDDAIVIVTVDSLGIPYTMTQELERKLAKSHGLKPGRLAIAASHTHSAPMLTNVAPTLFGTPIPPAHQQNIDRYTRELADNLEKVAVAALNDRKPARLSWAKGKAPFAANRRTPRGPVDHDVPVLRVTDEAGKIRALFVNYACHCTTLGGDFNKIHGDWLGCAQELLERSHPGAVALIAVGCGADSNPHPRGNLNLALQHGESIALEVARLLRGEWQQLPGNVTAKLDHVDLPYDKLPTREQWQARVKRGGAVGHHATVQLAKLDAGQQLPTTLRYPVQTWTFGDKLAMIFLPGEVVVDYSLRLKKEFDADRVWVNGYSNDAPCYIPSLRILQEGGYEGGDAMIYYDRPTRFAPAVEDIIFGELRKQIPPSFKAAKDPQEFPPPKEPKDSLADIKVRAGLRVELVAAEPLVQSPVAIDWGKDGKLWVVEMFDYPTGIDRNYKPGGRVKYLEDSDGNGTYDRAVTLAEDLPFPTGLLAWKKGVLVCAAPDILYLEDTNGDGKADIRKVLYTGFATENYQARVNSLELGLDGWVYAANGLLGGKITSKVGKPLTVEIGGRDIRIKPDTGEIEPVSGLSQQGRTRDDWGNYFGGDNSNLIRHYPLADHYLRRNPHFAPPPAYVNILTGDADPNRIFPISRVLKRYNDFGHVGRVTSACSPCIYRDNLLGDQFHGNAFICEPVHNLVTRRVLTPSGATFIGKRAADEQTSEFLASKDNWFRPVQVRTGPDGALWVVDMYRFVIEHPRWIPPERLAELDVRAGAERGRIYRVVPERAARQTPRPDKLRLRELVDLLQHPNGLDATSLIAALHDEHPGIRRHAIRLCESLPPNTANLASELAGRIDDPDASVRLQLACTLGQIGAPAVGTTLAKLALRDRADAYIVAAVMSSLNESNIGDVLTGLLGNGVPVDEALFARVIAVAPALVSAKGCDKLLALIAKSDDGRFAPWQFTAAAAMLDGMDRRGIKINFETKELPVGRLCAVAGERVNALDATEPERIAAIRLVGRMPGNAQRDLQRLGALVDTRQTPALRNAAVDRLAQLAQPEVGTALLKAWAAHSHELRGRVLDVLLSRPAWTMSLLHAVELGQVKPGDLDASRRQALLAHRDEAIKIRAAKVLQITGNADRRRVVETYQSMRALKGNHASGATVFAKTCSACHKIGNVGNVVGPDLAAVTDRSLDALLVAILDPNRALDGRYASLNALTKQGRQFSGLLKSESAAAITLVGPDGKSQDILRSDLEELTNTGKSHMPEGLEKDIPPQAMADLVAYLQGLGRPPKSVAGNTPSPVTAGPGDSYWLSATKCEIHGAALTFEGEFRNIGMWHGQDDHIAWSLEGVKPGRYLVAMNYACDDGSAGNVLIVQVGGEQLTTRVVGTGRWSDYVNVKLGEIEIAGPSARVIVKPGAPLRGALIDLREVRLTPVK